jgi:site-specific recombinase XerD
VPRDESEANTLRMLVAAGGVLAQVVRRIQRRQINDAEYFDLVTWGVDLRIVRGLSPNTVSNYLADVAEFLEWLGAEGVPIEAVDIPLATRWQRGLYLDRGEAARTRDGKLVAVRQLLAWREAQGRGQNPLRAMKGPKRAKPLPRKYSTSQLKALLRSCDLDTPMGRRDYTILLFFYATGARRQEVADLTLDQLELRQRTGRVRFRGKGCKERTVPFEGGIVPVLREWLLERDGLHLVDQDAVFVGFTGQAHGCRLGLSGLNALMSRAATAAGIREAKGLHRLRVTFATDLYDSGQDLETIRILMGHETIETTRQYIAISERQMQARLPASRLSEIINDEGGANEPLWIRVRRGAGSAPVA